MLLRGAAEHLEPYIPAGYLVKGSGGQGQATFTPWIAIFNPDETTSPERGIYPVYLFAQDMSTVTLSLNQGTTGLVEQHRQRAGRAYAREVLQDRAKAIRQFVSSTALPGFTPTLDLRSHGDRQIDYEHGHSVGIAYDLRAFPPESELEADLNRILLLYDEVLNNKERILGGASQASALGQLRVPYRLQPRLIFKPKDDVEYHAHVAERDVVRTPRHERLVSQFAIWAGQNGFKPANNVYPRDLVLHKDDREWLVEAEVIRGGRAAPSAREAIGQLFEYRHAHYRSLAAQPHLLALFSEPIGGFYIDVLEGVNIAGVWKSLDGHWAGSPMAVAQGLPVVGSHQ